MKPALTITIDTSKTEKSCARIQSASMSDKICISGKNHQAEQILGCLEQLQHAHAFDCTDITGIACVMGPGSFTGLRVGAIVALTLAALCGISVNGQSPLKSIDIEYGSDKWK